MATKEFFPGIEKIKFEGKDSKNPMAFRYYNAEKVINGKKMKDWLRFAMAWWHTLCAEGGDQFGGGTKQFPWNGNADAIVFGTLLIFLVGFLSANLLNKRRCK